MSSNLVLIIEDDGELSYMFARIARISGYDSEVIRNGTKALERINHSSTIPNLVFLDLHLPEVEGDAVLTKIRSDPLWKKVVVIIITGDEPAAHLHMSRRATGEPAADMVFLKPVDYKVLIDLFKDYAKPT